MKSFTSKTVSMMLAIVMIVSLFAIAPLSASAAAHPDITLTLDANGGVGGTESVVAVYGQNLPDITVPTREGYVLDGYYCEHGTKYYDNQGKGVRVWRHDFDDPMTAKWIIIPAVDPTVNVDETEVNCVYSFIDGETVSVEAIADDGAEYTLAYQWYHADGTKIDEATDSSYEIPSDLVVGTYQYYCVVSATRQDNEDVAEVTSDVITVNVSKATPVLNIKPAQKLVYNAKDQALLADCQTSGLAQDLVYNLDGGEYSSEIPAAKNAGTYVVGFKSVESDNYNAVDEATVTVKIDKAVPKYTLPTNLTATYGETLGDVDLSAYPGWAWVSSDATSVGNAGERSFSAKFTPEDTANYKTVTKQVKINVKKAPLTVTAGNQTVKYGDPVAQDKYTVSGLIGKDKVTVKLSPVISANAVKPTVTNCSNYNVKTVNGLLTIKLYPIASGRLSGKNVALKWSTVKNADGYLVYAGYCGSGSYPLFKNITNNTTTSITINKIGGKALNMKKNVFTYVVAYKNVNGKRVTLVRSASVHVAGSSTKFTDAKSVKVAASSVTLKVGKVSYIWPLLTLKDKSKTSLKCDPALQYASSNKSVAKVSAGGKITAVGKGTANIYVYALNGLKAKVTVTVK